MSVELGELLHPKLLEAITSSRENFVFAPEQTREFLKRVISEGAHNRKPDGISEKNWIRMRNIIGIYFGTGASRVQIGQIYGITNERVRQLEEEGIYLLWQNCPPNVREQFPIDQIPFAKNPIDYPEEYKLLVKDGVGNKIIRAVEEGLSLDKQGKAVGQIAESLSMPRNNILIRLRLLKRLGIEIPNFRDILTENKDLIAKLRDETLTNHEIQTLLDQARFTFCKVNASGQNPLLAHLFNILRGYGFRHVSIKENPRLIQILKEAGLPIRSFTEEVKSGKQKGIRHHHFMLFRHGEWVEKILEEKPELEKFKKSSVQQVCGPKVEPPSIWQLRKKKDFESPQNAVPEIKLNRQYRNLFTSECPEPIFKRASGDGYYSLKARRGKLRAYILNKLGMGISA